MSSTAPVEVACRAGVGVPLFAPVEVSGQSLFVWVRSANDVRLDSRLELTYVQ